MFRRCDGIGRRAGLKIQSWRQGAGSTPATGTKIRFRKKVDFFFFNMILYKDERRMTNLSLMKKYLQKDVISELENIGFTGKYPHYRREYEDCTRW